MVGWLYVGIIVWLDGRIVGWLKAGRLQEGWMVGWIEEGWMVEGVMRTIGLSPGDVQCSLPRPIYCPRFSIAV